VGLVQEAQVAHAAMGVMREPVMVLAAAAVVAALDVATMAEP